MGKTNRNSGPSFLFVAVFISLSRGLPLYYKLLVSVARKGLII